MIKRPKEVTSETTKMVTGCGNLYITIGTLEDKPIEVFIKLGKMGGCESCQNSALGIAISIALQNGVNILTFSDSLRGIWCPKAILGKVKVLSCPDAVSQVLREYMKEKK
jgi:ribonucleoside-diphosphate reductase alpha chain